MSVRIELRPITCGVLQLNKGISQADIWIA
jgi:hypothetical protein